MQNINQVLITLAEANRFACARNPHHQRLALVLLDNVVELQLRRKSEKSLMFDSTTWYSGVRKHDRKRRKRVSRFHGELLDLAVEEDWITEQVSLLLRYAHGLRNHFYHEGREKDETDLQLGITLLFRFINNYFPIWRGAGMLMCIPSEAPISIENAMTDESGRAPLQFGFEQIDEDDLFGATNGFQKSDCWKQILENIISYDFPCDVRPLISKRIENLIDEVDRHIKRLTEYDDSDFNGVMAHRFAIMTPWFSQNERDGKQINDPRVAVNIYLAVLHHEERLLDIADPKERAAEFHRIVNEHNFNKDIISSIPVDEYRRIARDVKFKPEADGISQFLRVQSELQPMENALLECAMDLNGYTQLMIDTIRGK